MLVRALFDHLERKRGRTAGHQAGPRLHQAPHENLDPATLWKRLRLPMPPPEPMPPPVGGPAPRTAAPRRRRPGRPGWTAELFWARYREACERADPPHTYRAVSRQFVTLDGTDRHEPRVPAQARPPLRPAPSLGTAPKTVPISRHTPPDNCPGFGDCFVLPPSCTLDPMSYYTVYLEGEDAERLRELAQAARRRPRSQADDPARGRHPPRGDRR